MRKLIALFVALLFATSVIVAAGCAKKEEPAKPAAPAPEKKAEEAKPEVKPEAKPAEPAKPPEKK